MKPMEDIRDEARKRVQAKKGFYTHFGIFAIVITFLAIINILTFTDGFWFLYPMFGWGVGVAIHYIGVFGFPGTKILSKEWEDDQMEKEMHDLLDTYETYPEEELDLSADYKEKQKVKSKNWDREDIV